MRLSAIDYKQEQEEMERLYREERYDLLGVKCALAIEQALKDFYWQGMRILPMNKKKTVEEEKNKINNKKDVDKFTMGMFINLLDKTGFIDEMAAICPDRNFTPLKMIRLDQLNRYRNDLIHNHEKADPHQARLLLDAFIAVKNVIEPEDARPGAAVQAPPPDSQIDPPAARAAAVPPAPEPRDIPAGVPKRPARGWLVAAGAGVVSLVLLAVFVATFLFDVETTVQPTGKAALLASNVGVDAPVRRLLDAVYTEKRGGAAPVGAAEVWYRRGPAGGATPWRKLDDGDTLTAGDAYQIRFFSGKGTYCYVFQVDSAGRIDWLHPRNPASPYSSGVNPLPEAKWITLPPDDGAFFLDDRQGVEHIYAVATNARWNELERMLTDAAAAPPRSGSVQVAFNLKTRGVGGVAPAGPAATVYADSAHGALAELMTGVDGIWVAEKWFRHE